MVHRQVVAEIDQVQSAVVGGRQEIGVLDQRQKGQIAIVDVEPVHAGHQRTIQAEDEDVCPEVLWARVALDEVGRQVHGQAGEEPRWQRGQQLVNAMHRA